MVLTADQERVKSLLTETVTLLCKNGLHFQTEFSIEGLIGITLDSQDVFLVSFKENIKVQGVPPATVAQSVIEDNAQKLNKRSFGTRELKRRRMSNSNSENREELFQVHDRSMNHSPSAPISDIVRTQTRNGKRNSVASSQENDESVGNGNVKSESFVSLPNSDDVERNIVAYNNSSQPASCGERNIASICFNVDTLGGGLQSGEGCSTMTTGEHSGMRESIVNQDVRDANTWVDSDRIREGYEHETVNFIKHNGEYREHRSTGFQLREKQRGVSHGEHDSDAMDVIEIKEEALSDEGLEVVSSYDKSYDSSGYEVQNNALADHGGSEVRGYASEGHGLLTGVRDERALRCRTQGRASWTQGSASQVSIHVIYSLLSHSSCLLIDLIVYLVDTSTPNISLYVFTRTLI